jgi:type I restriction enzyme S subunit
MQQTEVGELPADWRVVKLSSIASVTSGKRLPLGRSLVAHETAHPYIRVSDMRAGTVNVDGVQFVPEDVFPQIRQYCVSKDDLYISVAGTLGLVGCVPDVLDGANLTENANRISGLQVPREYLYQVLASPLVQSVIESGRTVGAQPKLALVRIRNFSIPLPASDEEQRAIGEALTDADTLIDSLEQLLSKQRQIKQGAMQELLSGQRRLPGFGGEWVSHTLSTLVSSPITDGPHETPMFHDDGIPFLSVNNIADNRIDWSEVRYVSRAAHEQYARKCRPQRGDLLLGKAASVGRIAVVEDDTEFNIWSPIALIRLKATLSNWFVFYQFQSRFLMRQIGLLTNSSSQGNIGMGDIERLEVLLPSLDEQHAIAQVLTDMDSALTALQARLAKARELKQALMQVLLTGRIRLLPPGATAAGPG